MIAAPAAPRSVNGVATAGLTNRAPRCLALRVEQIPAISSATRYRPDIDGLRAVAVLAVVLYHAGVPGVAGGFVGVDVFFVISGFLITGILAHELDADRFSIVGFYDRRVRRILPALVLVVAASFVAGWILLSPAALRDFAGSAAATALFASNVWFWQTRDYFTQAAELLPLLHTWSLAVEEQFYIIFPLLLFALRRWSRATLTLVIAAGCTVSFFLSVLGVAWMPTATFYLLPTRAWELGIGALLALVSLPAASRPLREAGAALGLAAILASVALIDVTTPFPGAAALPACLGAVALIWAGGQGPTYAGALLSLPAVAFVGLISYSLLPLALANPGVPAHLPRHVRAARRRLGLGGRGGVRGGGAVLALRRAAVSPPATARLRAARDLRRGRVRARGRRRGERRGAGRRGRPGPLLSGGTRGLRRRRRGSAVPRAPPVLGAHPRRGPVLAKRRADSRRRRPGGFPAVGRQPRAGDGVDRRRRRRRRGPRRPARGQGRMHAAARARPPRPRAGTRLRRIQRRGPCVSARAQRHAARDPRRALGALRRGLAAGWVWRATRLARKGEPPPRSAEEDFDRFRAVGRPSPRSARPVERSRSSVRCPSSAGTCLPHTPAT